MLPQLILLRFFFQPQTNRLETLSFSTKSLNKCPSWSFLLCLNHGLYSRYVLQTDACKSVERNNNLAWGIQKALEANQDKAPGRLWRFLGFPSWGKIAAFFWILQKLAFGKWTPKRNWQTWWRWCHLKPLEWHVTWLGHDLDMTWTSPRGVEAGMRGLIPDWSVWETILSSTNQWIHSQGRKLQPFGGLVESE